MTTGLETYTETIDGEDYERTKTKPAFKRSNRGFGIISFDDRFEQKCTLQESSLATEAAVWFGVENTGPHITGVDGDYNEPVQARMHLTRDMVKQLLPLLQFFAEKGCLPDEMKEYQAPPSHGPVENPQDLVDPRLSILSLLATMENFGAAQLAMVPRNDDDSPIFGVFVLKDEGAIEAVLDMLSERAENEEWDEENEEDDDFDDEEEDGT